MQNLNKNKLQNYVKKYKRYRRQFYDKIVENIVTAKKFLMQNLARFFSFLWICLTESKKIFNYSAKTDILCSSAKFKQKMSLKIAFNKTKTIRKHFYDKTAQTYSESQKIFNAIIT